MNWSHSRIINQAMDRLRRNQRVIVNTSINISLDEYITAINKVDLRSKQRAHLAAHRHATSTDRNKHQDTTVVGDA